MNHTIMTRDRVLGNSLSLNGFAAEQLPSKLQLSTCLIRKKNFDEKEYEVKVVYM